MTAGFGDLPARFCDPATAKIAILPVPYDRTSTWKKGADLGPQAIIEASHQVEWYDIPTGTEVYREGIATLDPVLCEAGPEELADAVDKQVGHLLASGVLPIALGEATKLEELAIIGTCFLGVYMFSEMCSPRRSVKITSKKVGHPKVWRPSIVQWFQPFSHVESMQQNSPDAFKHLPESC